MGAERRHYQRVPLPFDAKYRLYGDLSTSWRTIRTINISAGGMRFRSADLMEEGTVLDVQMTLPANPAPLVIKARIMWSQAMGSGVTENGAEFFDASPDEQAKIDDLVKFLTKQSPPAP